jgi:sulfopropanediol 3-dehydrogenase
LIEHVPEQVKADIRFAREQVRRFALAQRNSLKEFEISPLPGVRLGQHNVPIEVAGCYVPGGALRTSARPS